MHNYMHIIYLYTYAWTCCCNCIGEDFGEVDRWKVEGSTSLVKRSTVNETITVGEWVEIACGKSKKYYAVVLNVGGECHSQDTPQQGASVPQQGATTPQQGVSIPRKTPA